MSDDVLMNTLARQHATAWRLARHGLQDLTTGQCLWRPHAAGLHVRRTADGGWEAEWPAHEGYDLGPPSIAWITWHMGFWWSMVLDHSFGEGTLTREAVRWPGSADAVRDWLDGLQQRWADALAGLDDAGLAGSERTRWPFRDRPFGDVVAWVNLELTKNAAELGYARFLHAVSGGGAS